MKTEILMAERQQVEQALGESEQRYRRLLAATTDYIYTVKVENGRSGATSHGPGCAAVTGYTSAEFAADPYLWYRVIHEEDRDAVVAQASRILAGDVPPPLEHRLMHKQGGVRWVQNTTIPHHDPQGQLVAYDGLIADITSRKRAELLLAAEYAVTRDLAEWNTLAGAMPLVLEHLCKILLWHHATCWTGEAGALRCENEFWRAPLPAADFGPGGRRHAVRSGAGLPNRVWLRGGPVWVPDVSCDPDLACDLPPAKAGLRCGCAFPVHFNHQTVGVIELYSREPQQPDERMLEVLGAAGAHIGQFVEHRRSEEALEHERNLLRTLIDNLPDCVFVKDTESRFLLNNVAHARLLGANDTREALGRTDHDFFPQELAAQYRADEEAVLRSGKPLSNREEPVVNRTGQQHWFLTTKVPLKNADGKIIGLVGIARNITERKTAAERLRKSDERLRRSESIAHVGGWELDLATHGLTWSDEVYRIFGMERQESGVAYDEFLERVHPEDRAAVATAYSDSVRDGRDTYEIEHRVIRKSTGEVRIVHEKCEHVRDANGQIVRSVGMVQDITERRLAAQQLERAYERLTRRGLLLKTMVRQLKVSHKELKEAQLQLIQAAKLESLGTLAAGVAHEVKNPLQTILMGLDYLGTRLGQPDENLAAALNDMRDAVKRANTIIREMLSLSASLEFHWAEEDVNEVIRRSLMLVRNELIASHVTLKEELDPLLPRLPADSQKLQQVFINIFINGIQAMDRGGTLTVRTRTHKLDSLSAREPIFRRFHPGDMVIIAQVQDTGAGLSEAVLPKVFDPFFTTKPVGTGTGLGLSVARKIVALHGGEIEITNAPEGGALVTVVLKA
ncbi:MAG TPA: PAS domain S-box protein [Verrucomicrobiae bacterium]|nr:PAS domain S-box protein [Verrucomicrobiae bacterium]